MEMLNGGLAASIEADKYTITCDGIRQPPGGRFLCDARRRMGERSHERDLLKAWRDGDRSAGNTLIRGHAAVLQRFFANKVSSAEVVEELAQRTFYACAQGVERFRGDSNFRTWLFGVANNVLREYYRAVRRSGALDFGVVSIEDSTVDVDDFARGVSSLVAASQELRRLLAALRRIPIDAQVLLELYYWEELSAPELAEIFEIPVGTVRGRLSKAKLLLRAELDAMDRNHERPPTTDAQLEDWAQAVRRQM